MTICTDCHVSAANKDKHDPARLVFSGGERKRTDSALKFDHGSKGHQQRACSECHTPTELPRGDFLTIDYKFETATMAKACASCHDHGDKDPSADKQRNVRAPAGAAQPAAWNRADSCESCHKAGAPRLLDGHRRAAERGFRHTSHLPKGGGACAECHAMDRATAAKGVDIELKGCAECHFGAGNNATAALVDDLRVLRVPTRFAHTTEGHRQDCATCHEMAPGANDPVVGRLYVDCTKTCHQEQRVERHGEWRCDNCHRSSSPVNETAVANKFAIATTEVTRPRDGSRFAFAGMAHPGITPTGAAVHAGTEGRACTDCHRQQVPGLVHAAEPQPFGHAGHLVSVAGAQDRDCTSCHMTVRESTRAADTLAFQTRLQRESSNCTLQCHQTPEMAVTADIAEVAVPVFSHAQHAARSCTECHVADGQVAGLRAAPLQDAGKAFSCARCHGHKEPEKIARTGGYATTGRGDVDTCGVCHAPKEKPAYDKIERTKSRYQLASGLPQYHYKGGDCAACHELEQQRAEPARTPIRITSHLDPHKKHSGVKLPNGEVKDVPAVDDDYIRDPKNCLDCHAWTPGR
ncbi:MAG: hypothetical protein H6835_09560 [Planctomycetes bacterium]|nr:hypothetical protein [Planctomycetota bacterium]